MNHEEIRLDAVSVLAFYIERARQLNLLKQITATRGDLKVLKILTIQLSSGSLELLSAEVTLRTVKEILALLNEPGKDVKDLMMGGPFNPQDLESALL